MGVARTSRDDYNIEYTTVMEEGTSKGTSGGGPRFHNFGYGLRMSAMSYPRLARYLCRRLNIRRGGTSDGRTATGRGECEEHRKGLQRAGVTVDRKEGGDITTVMSHVQDAMTSDGRTVCVGYRDT